MESHDLPTDPALRSVAECLNELWSHYDSEFIERALDVARRMLPGEAESTFKELVQFCASSDASLDERSKHGVIAFLIMRAHGLVLHSNTTEEAISICEDCGTVHVMRPAIH